MRKAQFKMFETIAILVVFFFILILGLTFYASVEKKKIETTSSEFKQLKEVEIAQLISYMPELECPTSLETENCIDLYKVLVIKDIFSSKKSYYYDLLGYSTITVYDLDKEYLIYDNPKQGSFSRMYIPVSLYNATKKIKQFGILNITIY